MTDRFGSLPVNRVALTSLGVRHQPDAAPTLYAMLAAWADLSAIEEACKPLDHDGMALPPLRTIDAYLLADQARIALVVSPLAPDPDDAALVASLVAGPASSETVDGLTPAATASSRGLPTFTIILPTTAVALALTLSSTPLLFRLALLDGEAPAEPEFRVFGVRDLSTVIQIAPDMVGEVLEGAVSEALTAPFEVDGDEDDEDNGPDVAVRAVLWTVTAGTALGQETAWRRLVGFGEWAHRQAVADESNVEQIQAIIDVATTMQMLSMESVEDIEVPLDVDALPGRLAFLKDLIREDLDDDALAALDEGAPFASVAQEHGLEAAIPALGVLVASRALVYASHPEGRDASPSWLVGMWLDPADDDEPWWTMPAVAPLLAHHDTAVIADLLSFGAGAGAGAGMLLERFVHMLADAIIMLDLDRDELTTLLAAQEVRLANFADVTALAETLVEASEQNIEDHDNVCHSCASIQPVLSNTWGVARTARAAAALLPLLADISAEGRGYPVGDETWVSHRSNYLKHWLYTAAV